MSKYTYTVKTQFGLENVLADELRQLGATDIEILNRAVQFTGDQRMLYRCNLHLRTALKILKPFATFTASTGKELYDRVKEIDWSEYMTVRQTFSIDSTVFSERFNNSLFLSMKAKDAIADQFREKVRRRPNVDTRTPDVRINLHLNDRTVTLSLDSSGTSLDRRGYRLARTEAPINEVLAAGILKLIGYDGSTDLLDPMCGSGTFSVEAAMMVGKVPPGRSRSFGFEKWTDFDKKLWEEVKAEADAERLPVPRLRGRPTPTIFASDLDPDAVGIAKENAMRAGVEEYISFKTADFLQSKKSGESGFLVFNPPYDERLKRDEIEDFYRQIGTHLKHHYEGWQAAVISGNLSALKLFGLRPAQKWTLFNGAIECRLCRYDLFGGKMKAAYGKGEEDTEAPLP